VPLTNVKLEPWLHKRWAMWQLFKGRSDCLAFCALRISEIVHDVHNFAVYITIYYILLIVQDWLSWISFNWWQEIAVFLMKFGDRLHGRGGNCTFWDQVAMRNVFLPFTVILNLSSPSWTNSLCLQGRYLANPKLHFLTEYSGDDKNQCYMTSVSQNIRPMTTENRHSILDRFRISFSWHFSSKWCEKYINFH
jgi:hypothetical protein